ncbi:glycoside hydrolase family 32 protein [Halomicroarcula sp. F27]|uniref:Glycoside hydrolase family 32 protein n=2 Tax=Haloarcula nitratireducens TaxID=2487749 RepID=A0AAW4PGQ8_9EURY|nr:glycoside hydrolase family 32 protein [Halomicroarcula nitratireducens]
MNDPNGLVYKNGTYHLFYQAGEWPRRWDHATSTDLINWTEHGTKIPAVEPGDTAGISPFSGGAVIDENDTAGFGEDALVAMYTGHHYGDGFDAAGIEDQRVAYSTDNGETVHKYEENPVLPSDVGDWRDPRPLWYESDGNWRMVITRVSPAENRPAGVEIWESSNLKDWEYLSTYESGGEPWETPNLEQLPVEGTDESAWVVSMSAMDPRRVEHHIGCFDGTEFTAEKAIRADHGFDFYAPQYWANTPENRGLYIAWMNNWNYAMETPDNGWQGEMTVPRTISLVDGDDGPEVRQHPASELTEIRQEQLAELSDKQITPSNADQVCSQEASASGPLSGTDVDGRTLEIVATIDPQDADEVGLRVREGDEQASIITYDAANEELRFDRTNAGEFFDEGEYGVADAPLKPLCDGTIELRVFVDRSSVEIFANEGRKTMTNLVFPDWESTGVSLFADGGTATLEHLIAYDLSTES